jgi:hypothetical protein
VLQAQQIVTRALGIWGIYLMAVSLGLEMWPSVLVAAIVSLGANVAGPQVLTLEYEPTPRAFAVPLLFCAIGLAAHARYRGAVFAGIAAVLYHAPTTAPFWVVMVPLLVVKRKYGSLAAVAAAILVLVAAGRMQAAEHIDFFSRLTAAEQQLQLMRVAYSWVSTWPASTIVHYAICWTVALAGVVRLWRYLTGPLRAMLLGLPLLGMLSMPVSWLLLERLHWSLTPQVQPMRALLFVAFAMQFAAAAAGVLALAQKRRVEAGAWFAAAYVLPIHAIITAPIPWQHAVLVVALAAATAAARRYAPVAALAAFLVIPTAGGIVNYPNLHTPELAELSQWAASATDQNAVFLFADARRALHPGIFRSDAQRAVFVDWKGGGQVNYLKGFGSLWWERWQQTLAEPFRPSDLLRYPALGITHVVLGPGNRLPQETVFANSRYLVYAILPGPPSTAGNR